MVNDVTLVGRVAREVNLRKVSTGVSVATIVLAVDRDYVDADGKRETDFIDVEVWNKTAEYCARNIEKGRLIAVSGSIRTNRYETKDGQKRTSILVRANKVRTLEKPRNLEAKKDDKKVENQYMNVELTEDDMPF